MVCGLREARPRGQTRSLPHGAAQGGLSLSLSIERGHCRKRPVGGWLRSMKAIQTAQGFSSPRFLLCVTPGMLNTRLNGMKHMQSVLPRLLELSMATGQTDPQTGKDLTALFSKIFPGLGPHRKHFGDVTVPAESITLLCKTPHIKFLLSPTEWWIYGGGDFHLPH